MGVSENDGTPKSSILIGFSIVNHPFWGIPIFGNTHINKLAYLMIVTNFQPDSKSTSEDVFFFSQGWICYFSGG